MKKFLFLIMISSITLSMSYKTFAFFNSAVESENNTINSGTLNLSMETNTSRGMQFLNLEPGKEEIQTVKLQNIGTLPLRVWSICLKRDAKKTLGTSYVDMIDDTFNSARYALRIHSTDDICAVGMGKMLFKIDDEDILEIPVRLIDNNNFIFYNNEIIIEPGTMRELQIVVELDSNLGNEFQGNILNFDMEVKAVQTNYNGGIDISGYKIGNPTIAQCIVVERDKFVGFNMDGSNRLITHIMVGRINNSNPSYRLASEVNPNTTVKAEASLSKGLYYLIINNIKKINEPNNICANPRFALYVVNDNIKSDIISIDSISNGEKNILRDVRINFVK